MWFQCFLKHSHEKEILSWSSEQEALLAEAVGSHGTKGAGSSQGLSEEGRDRRICFS